MYCAVYMIVAHRHERERHRCKQPNARIRTRLFKGLARITKQVCIQKEIEHTIMSLLESTVPSEEARHETLH